MSLWREHPGPEVAAALEPLFLLAAPRGDLQQELRAEHYVEICALLPRAAEVLYRHWHA
jgi:hypothetical protein